MLHCFRINAYNNVKVLGFSKLKIVIKQALCSETASFLFRNIILLVIKKGSRYPSLTVKRGGEFIVKGDADLDS